MFWSLLSPLLLVFVFFLLFLPFLVLGGATLLCTLFWRRWFQKRRLFWSKSPLLLFIFTSYVGAIINMVHWSKVWTRLIHSRTYLTSSSFYSKIKYNIQPLWLSDIEIISQLQNSACASCLMCHVMPHQMQVPTTSRIVVPIWWGTQYSIPLQYQA